VPYVTVSLCHCVTVLGLVQRAGVNNPVMLVDELDKTGTDAGGKSLCR